MAKSKHAPGPCLEIYRNCECRFCRIYKTAPDYHAAAKLWLDVQSAMFSMRTMDDKIAVLKRAKKAFDANRNALLNAMTREEAQSIGFEIAYGNHDKQ